jgi:hypothetical protein
MNIAVLKLPVLSLQINYINDVYVNFNGLYQKDMHSYIGAHVVQVGATG